jgi:DNA-binding CsgD family transcriptional regulator
VPLAARIAGIVRRNWITIIGLICVTYIWAALLSARLNGLAIVVEPGAFGYIGVALGACAAALLFCVLLILEKADLVSLLELVLPPVCAVAMALVRFFGDWSGGIPTLVSNMPLGFSTSALLILVFMESRREIGNGAMPFLVVGGTVAFYVAFFVVVLLVWPHLTDRVADSVSQGMLVVFAGGTAIWMVLKAQKLLTDARSAAVKAVGGEIGETGVLGEGGEAGETSRTSKAGATSEVPVAAQTADNLSATCDSLAQRYSLSPREHEVLLLLAQGRGAPYISDKICVSSNTVKTHIKRIYQKCNVHSKEDLLDLIQGSGFPKTGNPPLAL